MKMAHKKILPIFNRVAIFSTTDFSYHGHPDPLTCPPDRSRRSLAFYYYTNGRPASEINKGIEEHTTLFKSREGIQDDTIVVKEKVTLDTVKRDFERSPMVKKFKKLRKRIARRVKNIFK